MNKWIALPLAALLALGGVIAATADYTVKDAASATQTIFAFVCSSTKICPAHVLIKSDGTEIGTSSNPVQVSLANTASNTTAVKVDNSAVTQPISSAMDTAITGIVSSAAEGTHVFKASAGTLYSAYVTAGSTSGYLMIFNATSAPADGAVTPIHCVVVPALQTVSLSFNPGPGETYATGISAAFSTTGCFTKTVSATAFFHGSVK
jgi:hypothetical protein